MKRFQDLSIRTKLTLLLMSISVAAVLAATLAFYSLVSDQYRQSYHEDIKSLTGILAANCRAALMFKVPEDAEQLLASLRNRPSIISARIYDSEGKLFAAYGNELNPAAPPVSATGAPPLVSVSSGFLSVSRAIEMNGKTIGVISLHDDMRSIVAFRHFALLTLVVIVLLVIGLSFFIAARLREFISKPITELARVTQEISRNQDYSLRAQKHGDDEVGSLVDSFNEMLGQIAERSDALLNSERRYRAFVNQAADAFFLHDFEGRFLDVNQRACDSLGYTRAELLRMTVSDIDPQLDIRRTRERYWRGLLPERPVTIEGRHRRKDGESYPVEIRLGILELGGEKMIISLARDISERLTADKERRQMESRLLQSQKLESIGTLAGGIAHDFNNILTPIYGHLELAMLKYPAQKDIMGHLQEVYKAAGRARDLVKQILTFSRRDSEQQSPVEVQVIIKEAMKLLRASIPTTIEIRQNIASSCAPVLANPTQIHQILMNLCTNAYHAMRESGGVLGVLLGPVEISSQDFLKNLNLKPGSYLLLEVSDTGCGMDQETLGRALEPYFTTKPTGEGTGMGLAVVHGIVQGYGGGITLYSEPGQGTTIKIYLPTSDRHSDQANPVLPAFVATGHERVLLVDDESAVREVETAMIESLGYQVMAFGSPDDALQAFTAHPERFDLVVTDMTMPRMTGEVFAGKVMQIRPALPVIVCTGFSELINEESARSMGIRAFVTKPLMRQEFSRTVRAVLDGEPPG